MFYVPLMRDVWLYAKCVLIEVLID